MSQLQFLGTGWSHGVPTIGCTCQVCTERKPVNVRRRASLLLRADDGMTVLIDAGPDFRDQALTFGIQRLDAVCITHQHADHVMGLDDVRRFTWTREDPLPLYADPQTLERLKVLYPYVAPERSATKAVPLMDFTPWTESITVGPFTLDPITVPHAGLPCYGIRIRAHGVAVGYVPDASELTPDALDRLAGVDIMILNALRLKPHPHHLSLEQCIGLLQKLRAPNSYITHMGCPIDYDVVQPTLPNGIQLAKDGLTLEFS